MTAPNAGILVTPWVDITKSFDFKHVNKKSADPGVADPAAPFGFDFMNLAYVNQADLHRPIPLMATPGVVQFSAPNNWGKIGGEIGAGGEFAIERTFADLVAADPGPAVRAGAPAEYVAFGLGDVLRFLLNKSDCPNVLPRQAPALCGYPDLVRMGNPHAQRYTYEPTWGRNGALHPGSQLDVSFLVVAGQGLGQADAGPHLQREPLGVDGVFAGIGWIHTGDSVASIADATIATVGAGNPKTTLNEFMQNVAPAQRRTFAEGGHANIFLSGRLRGNLPELTENGAVSLRSYSLVAKHDAPRSIVDGLDVRGYRWQVPFGILTDREFSLRHLDPSLGAICPVFRINISVVSVPGITQLEEVGRGGPGVRAAAPYVDRYFYALSVQYFRGRDIRFGAPVSRYYQPYPGDIPNPNGPRRPVYPGLTEPRGVRVRLENSIADPFMPNGPWHALNWEYMNGLMTKPGEAGFVCGAFSHRNFGGKNLEFQILEVAARLQYDPVLPPASDIHPFPAADYMRTIVIDGN